MQTRITASSNERLSEQVMLQFPSMFLQTHNIHWSATKLKQLIGEINNTDHFVTMQCSARKPWVLAFIWMPLDMHHPFKHCCRPSYIPSITMALPDGGGLPIRIMYPATPASEMPKQREKSSRLQILIWSCIYGMYPNPNPLCHQI